MERATKSKKVYVTLFTIKSANNRVQSTKTGREPLSRNYANGKFVSRDELKSAFKTASRKLKSAV